MALSLRQIKSRIRSIDSTKKLTRAMEMVSVAKLKRCQALFENSRRYCLKVEELLNNILSGCAQETHPLLEERQEKKNICLFLISSDNGLCGVYNHGLIRLAEEFLSRYPKDKLKLVTVGKKGFVYFQKMGFRVTDSFIGFNGRYSQEFSDKLSRLLTEAFLSGEADEVYFAYNQLDGPSKARPVVEKFLNLAPPVGEKIDYIIEPGRPEVLEELIPVFIRNKVMAVLLDAFTSEHQARAVSMGVATENAIELLESLVLLRNKVRQANITREIIEVISAAEALRG